MSCMLIHFTNLFTLALKNDVFQMTACKWTNATLAGRHGWCLNQR